MTGQPDAGSGQGASSSRSSRLAVWRQRLSLSPRNWRWLIIPLCGSVGLAAGTLWALSVPRIYTASTYAFVGLSPRPADDPNSGDPFAGGKFPLQRAPTYAALATSTDVLQAVVADIHHGSVNQLRRQVQAAAIPDSVIIQITAEDPDHQTAIQIADSVTANLARTVASLELGGTGPVELGGAQHAAASPPVQIVPVQPAVLGPMVARRYKALGGLIAGLMFGTAAFYLLRSRRDAGQRRRELSQVAAGPRARR
jgi:capsular polysaccharide biosynthesis protein